MHQNYWPSIIASFPMVAEYRVIATDSRFACITRAQHASAELLKKLRTHTDHMQISSVSQHTPDFSGFASVRISGAVIR
jgi:hypothetical protein